MSFGVTLELDQPWFTGAPSLSDVPGLVPVAIGGHGYMLEPSMFERQTIERFRNPYDQSKEPGEHSLSIKGPWLRSNAGWGHGSSQVFWDHPASDREMFRASKGLDIWTDQHRVQLLHDTRNVRSSAGTNLKVLAVNGYLYIVDSQQVYWTTDSTSSGPIFTSSVIHVAEGAQTVNDITTDGVTVYAAVGTNGIHKTALGASVSTHFSAVQATLIQYANGRLLAAAGNALSEIDAAGAIVGTGLKTHASSSFVWTTVAQAPNGIYAAGNLGDRSEFYFIGLTAAHILDVPISVGGLPDGETINVMAFYNGVMVLGTSIGLRLATIGTSNGIEYQNAIPIPGGVTAVEPQGSFLWFSWSNYDGVSTGLGRAALNVFTDTLIPAYTSDLMSTVQGVVPSIATFGTRRYYTVKGAGFYAEFTNLVSEGTMHTGWITYSTGERKVALSLDMRHEPLSGSITTSIIEEDGTETTVGETNIQGSLSPPDPLSIGNVSSEAFELVFTFNSGTNIADRLLEDVAVNRLLEGGVERTLEGAAVVGGGTEGPRMRRWTLRALVTPIRYDEILCPIIMHEKVLVTDEADGHEHELDPLAEWHYLKQLEATGVPVIFQLGTTSEAVYVEQVIQPAHKDRRWTPDRGFLQGVVTVRMVTL